MIFEIIEEVTTHSGLKADEYPVEFVFHGKRLKVKDIVDRWYEGGIKAGTPIYNYFKVQTQSEETHLLRHNLRYDSWAILIS